MAAPLALLTFSLAANSADSLPEEIDVTAERLKTKAVGQSVTTIDVEDSVALRIDSLLSEVPGVGLFRRANSLSAHPTIQGLNMRGVGANGAGRVLVTYDGVPITDPFGGWVYWSGLPKQAIKELRVQKGGSAGSGGAQALVGRVDIISDVPEESGGFASASLGAFDSYDLNAGLSLVGEKGYVTVTAGHFESDGFFLLNEEQRGPIDTRAASEATSASIKARYALSDSTTIFPTVRYYREERENGFEEGLNETEAVDASLRVLHEAASGALYEVTSYYRDRQFNNVFVAARDERTVARPVLDQFDIPGWGAGFLARVQWNGFEAGVDGRRNNGETNERFRNLGAGFTRVRRAGGDQWIVGAYADYQVDETWGSISGSLRLDRYKTYNGERVETSLEDGSEVRNDTIENQSDWIWSGRIGAERRITGAIDIKGAAYKSWRLPTLNEYYRPFRVGNDITEANPNLEAETLYGIEIGFEYQPLNNVEANITFFRNWLKDGVGNITVGFGPGFFPLGGFVPNGGVLRQRANIDESITDGIEFDASLRLQNGLSFGVAYLFADSRISDFDARPELEGLRPVQTPKHSFTLSAEKSWQGAWLKLEGLYRSSQFDDDLNERRLGGFFTVNAAARVEVSDGVKAFANIENLFDAEVISALSATGLETIAQRRFWQVGLEVTF